MDWRGKEWGMERVTHKKGGGGNGKGNALENEGRWREEEGIREERKEDGGERKGLERKGRKMEGRQRDWK